MATTSDSRLRGHGLNYVLPCQTLCTFFTLHCSSSLSYICMNEYLAMDIGGYLGMNSLYASIAVSLGASQRSRNGVALNRFAR